LERTIPSPKPSRRGERRGKDWKKVLADRRNWKNVTKKAHAGRGLEAI
jgi:hypothetical protein